MQSSPKISPPITLLQEICSRNGLTPDYQLLSTEGSVHEPTFKIAVTVADISAIASGQSKKKARHAAARDAIEKLRQKKELNFDGINLDTLAPADDDEGGQSSYSIAVNDANPVGKLQEICMKMRVNPPDYDTCDERGLAHERVFYLSCRVASLNLSTIGLGRSKKLAKRQAAELMLDQLENTGIYDKATCSKGKADQGVESLFIDSNDNTHFVQSRRQLREFIARIDSSEKELRDDIESIDKHGVDCEILNSMLKETVPTGYHTEFHYTSNHICSVKVFETGDCEDHTFILSATGSASDVVGAMKQAVKNVFRHFLVFKYPLATKDPEQSPEQDPVSDPPYSVPLLVTASS